MQRIQCWWRTRLLEVEPGYTYREGGQMGVAWGCGCRGFVAIRCSGSAGLGLKFLSVRNGMYSWRAATATVMLDTTFTEGSTFKPNASNMCGSGEEDIDASARPSDLAFSRPCTVLSRIIWCKISHRNRACVGHTSSGTERFTRPLAAAGRFLRRAGTAPASTEVPAPAAAAGLHRGRDIS